MSIDYLIFDRDKFTILYGSITEDGILSGHSTSTINILNTKSTIDVYIKLSVGSGTAEWQNIFDIGDRTNGIAVLRQHSANRIIVRVEGTDYWFKSGTTFANNEYYLHFNINLINKIVTVFQNDIQIGQTSFSNSMTLKNNFEVWAQAEGTSDLKQAYIIADGVEVFSGSHKGKLTDKLIFLNETKNRIKDALIGKGVEVTSNTPFREYADKIGQISGSGIDATIVHSKLDNIIGEVL